MQVLFSANKAVPAGAVSVVVTATDLVLPYQVIGFGPNWLTGVEVTGKTAFGFTLVFTVPAPAGGGNIDYSIVQTFSDGVVGDAVFAGDIITSVRDLIPDPSYAADNVTPLPDGNGLFRASTLYRWLNDAVRALARASGSIIKDWTAIPQVNGQPWYPVNTAWINLDSGFSNQWPINTISLTEADAIWPTTSQSTGQSLWGYYRKQSDHLEFGLWPIPNLTDPATTLVNPIAASGADPIVLASTLNFLSFGYVQIDNEILQYQQLNVPSANRIGIISRGVCGTTAAAHAAGARVQHLGLWVKGERVPAKIVASGSRVELPQDLVMYCELYVLSKCRESEQEDRAARIMKEFDQKCAELRADPSRKTSVGQMPAYGTPTTGPIYFQHGAGGVIIP